MLLPALVTMAAGAALDLDSWQTAPLAAAATGTGASNNWYLFPDANDNPRVLVKATGTGATVNHRILTGGPPNWTAGALTGTPSLNKQGVIVPYTNGSAYVIAPHNTELWLRFFNAAGELKLSEKVDRSTVPVPISSIGLSAARDAGGGLHIVYLGSPNTTSETLRYAFRSASGDWTWSTPRDLSTQSQFVRQTVVIPSDTKAAKIYASLQTGTVYSLLRATVTNANIAAGSAENLGNNIAEHIAGNRLGGVDRLYYFAKAAQDGFWNLKQAGLTDPVQTIGLCSPTSIICAPGPDNKQRIVWLDGLAKEIHYLKPGTTSAYDVLHPVTDTNGTAEVRGLHFKNGKPHLLYRNSLQQAFMAFPGEDLDTDGNGRSDLIDLAFNSSTAGIKILPTAPSAPGLPLSENKFKFQIPTIGSAISNGAGGLFSNSKSITYGVETSTDAVTWTTLGASSPLIIVQSSVSGTFPNELKTFSVMYNETIPAAPSKRFFRIKITRPAAAY
ncbi:hypothetical protein [Luteolibacter arcticus]|uniref:hypothetical protein n=1 Tax=Luteolibacter arcticus TaxID=1581411 RepID=UPI002222D264|nr:hypothetical protein [Luteolibacter arcticus]